MAVPGGSGHAGSARRYRPAHVADLAAVTRTGCADDDDAGEHDALPLRFENYQPFAEEKVLPWKEANDAVRAIGGWRAYAKEANEEAGASQAPPAGSVDPAAGRARP